MAAYGAGVYLLKTLLRFEIISKRQHPRIEALFHGVNSLKNFLVENRGGVKSEFETQIRDAIYEAQDIIDTQMWSTHFLSPSEAEIRSESFHGELERVKERISSLVEMTTEEFNHLTLDRKISCLVWRDSDEFNCTKNYRMVGRDEEMNELKDRLMKGSDSLQVVPIVGVAGMGKTTLARFLLEDPLIESHYDAIGWVKVSAKYNKHDIVLDILASMKRLGISVHDERNHRLIEDPYDWSNEIRQQTEEELVKHIYNYLKRKKYIILLDDIRDIASWNDLKELFPNSHDGSRILLTTRDVDVAPDHHHLLDRLSNEDTLALLLEMVFRREQCPAHLARLAKDIALSCRGLPHAVVTVGKLLCWANPTAEYWEVVLTSIISMKDYVELMEALVSLTYNHLPQHVKVCFLYMASFPYNYVIPSLKILIQWVIEGFVEFGSEEMRITAAGYLKELLRRGFLILCVKNGDALNASLKIAEEVFHDFLVRKAEQEKFFLVINKDAWYALRHGLGDTSYNQQRRLCIQQNIHHVIKDLSTCNLGSSARSLIYSGPELQFRLGLWPEEFKLLEVLDAPRIGFYIFPQEILKSVQLKYLALSYSGQLPPTVCNLQELEILIVLDYLNLKCSGAPSYLPEEIWDLKYLMHLQVVGSNLPKPPPTTYLKYLVELSGVGAHSCTHDVFRRIPNIETLEVQIESLQDESATKEKSILQDESETLGFFSYLGILRQLGDFKCIVIYPEIVPEVIPRSVAISSSSLGNLTLNGCGFRWEYMRSIATLPNLEFLKLQNYAFQGPKWEVKIDEFPKLRLLHLEDTDLEDWTFNSSTWPHYFLYLQDLIIRHCYKLRRIPSGFGRCLLDLLEVVDCRTSTMDSALLVKEELQERWTPTGGSCATKFDIYSSRDD